MYRLWFENTLPTAYAPLIEGAAVVVGSAAASPEAPFAALAQADAIIASGGIRYDSAVLDLAPRVRVLSRTGIGLDNVVVADATARGIAVCYAPEAPTVSTAEHAITLLLAVAKDLKRIDRMVRQGVPRDMFARNRGIELAGLCLGVVGLGRIGGRVATMARGLGMNVVGFDPWAPPQRAADLGVEPVPSLEELLRRADAVTLHVPLTPETRHLIDAARLAQMKPGAILVNAARGGLVDEAALLVALESGRLFGAGLDVFEVEPLSPQNPLLSLENVVATPHIASSTTAGRERIWTTALTQALQVLRGERPPYLVNPEVWPQPA